MFKIEDRIPFAFIENKNTREPLCAEVDHRNDAVCLDLPQFSIRAAMSSECARELAAALNEHARQIEARGQGTHRNPLG